MSKCFFTDYGGSTSVVIEEGTIDTYIINAVSNITYTLPEIICNGMNFKFNRIDDSSNTVTLSAKSTSSDMIYSGSEMLSKSITIQGYQSIEVHSCDNIWYLLRKSNNTSGDNMIFSTSIVGNNGLTDVGLQSIYIPYIGSSSGIIPSRIMIAGCSIERQPAKVLFGYFSETLGIVPICTTSAFIPITASVNQLYPFSCDYSLTDQEKATLPKTPSVLYISSSNIGIRIWSLILY